MAASSRADLYASRYPVLVLRNVVLLPGHAATIAVASPEGQRAVDFARRQEAALAVVVYADGRAPNMLTPQVGTLARIAEVVPQPDQRWQVRVEGLRRVRVLSLDVTSPAPQARIELLFPPVTPQAHTMAQRVRTLAGELHRAVGIPDAETLRVLEATEDPTGWLTSWLDNSSATSAIANACSNWSSHTSASSTSPR